MLAAAPACRTTGFAIVSKIFGRHVRRSVEEVTPRRGPRAGIFMHRELVPSYSGACRAVTTGRAPSKGLCRLVFLASESVRRRAWKLDEARQRNLYTHGCIKIIP